MKQWLFGLAAVAFACVSSGCVPHTVGSTEVGVRVKKFALLGSKGVQERSYSPGTYFFLPFINDWYTLDTRIENLEMTYDARSGDLRMRDDLLFKTIDGNDISLDVIISYRLDATKGPHILQYVGKNNQIVKENIVRVIARSKPRDIFGELRTEEFYISSKRSEKAQKARQALNDLLNPYGVVVENVLTKDYRFNQDYQKAIEDKKVADQQTQKNISATKAAREEYLKRLEEAKGEVNKMIAKVDGDFQRAKIASDAYYEQQEKIAEAIKVEGLAEAQAISKMNEALAGSGGLTMVKLELAKALEGKRIVVMPFSQGGIDLKSTNVNEIIDTYGVKKLSQKQS